MIVISTIRPQRAKLRKIGLDWSKYTISLPIDFKLRSAALHHKSFSTHLLLKYSWLNWLVDSSASPYLHQCTIPFPSWFTGLAWIRSANELAHQSIHHASPMRREITIIESFLLLLSWCLRSLSPRNLLSTTFREWFWLPHARGRIMRRPVKWKPCMF